MTEAAEQTARYGDLSQVSQELAAEFLDTLWG
jgi:hypothetical protein